MTLRWTNRVESVRGSRRLTLLHTNHNDWTPRNSAETQPGPPVTSETVARFLREAFIRVRPITQTAPASKPCSCLYCEQRTSMAQTNPPRASSNRSTRSVCISPTITTGILTNSLTHVINQTGPTTKTQTKTKEPDLFLPVGRRDQRLHRETQIQRPEEPTGAARFHLRKQMVRFTKQKKQPITCPRGSSTIKTSGTV